jgi:hypothetical protein
MPASNRHAPGIGSSRNWVVVRADHDSRHPEWVANGAGRNFDLFVSYFGSQPNDFRAHADYYEEYDGMKWPRLYDLFRERRAWFLSYDACWLADDDLSCDAHTISRMFDLFHAHDLWLAQPALGPGSYVNHPITARVRGSRLRFTSFVEVMAPIFSRATLTRLAETFSQGVSGWGLDHLWARSLGNPTRRMAVLDETPVIHTRRLGTGRAYQRCAELGVSPQAELARIVKEHRIPRLRYVTYATLLSGGTRLVLKDADQSSRARPAARARSRW